MVTNNALGGLNGDLLPGLAAHEGLSEGGILGHGVVHHVRLLGADDFVNGQLLTGGKVGDRDLAANGDLIGIGLRLIDDLGVEQDLLQLGNAGIELALLVFGLVIFAVLRQVAEAAGFLDELGDLVGPGGLAVVQLCLQLVISLLAHFEFFNHGYASFQ